MPPQQQAATPTSTSQTQSAKIPPDQLDSLVAPIALYPDPLLAQVLAASTYPLEIIQLQQWLTNHKNLKDKALADAVAKESWDPSIQAMAALPDLVNRLANDRWDAHCQTISSQLKVHLISASSRNVVPPVTCASSLLLTPR